MQMGQVDSTFVRSSYGRICAAYLCIVGSVKDSTDGRNITSKENMLHLLVYFSPPPHFRLMLVDILLDEDQERSSRKETETEGDDRN